MQPIIFVLGKPGCGKGTVCSYIQQHLQVAYFSAGELLRQEVNQNPNSDLAKSIVADMKAGRIVPPQVTVKLLQNGISKHPEAKGILIDGFPRELEQFEYFKTKMNENRCFLLHLFCKDEDCISRIQGRNQGRVDDNIETIRARLKHFEHETMKVVNMFQQKDRLLQIDACGTKASVGVNALNRIAAVVGK